MTNTKDRGTRLMEKPFYISQLPEKTQAWIKEKTKENFLKDGMSEEEAEQKATDFLDEKVYVAEEFFGKDFYKSLDPAEEKPDYEVVNDFSIDAIKDNFTPPGARKGHLEEDYPPETKITKEDEERFGKDALKGLETIDTNDNGKIEVDEMADFQKSLDDYASKNKKGRDDIPVTTRR